MPTQQKCLNKWIGSAPLGTRYHNFQPPTPTVSPQTFHPQNVEILLIYDLWSLSWLISSLITWPFCLRCYTILCQWCFRSILRPGDDAQSHITDNRVRRYRVSAKIHRSSGQTCSLRLLFPVFLNPPFPPSYSLSLLPFESSWGSEVARIFWYGVRSM